MKDKPFNLIFGGVLIVLLLGLTGLFTKDRGTWLMEVTPVVIALPILLLTYKSFPLTRLLYLLIFIHAIVLIVGGYYTYAEVPFGFWIKDMFSLSRNPYDRIGHFLQGFVPALIARELFIRRAYVSGKKMTFFLSICVVMTVSASYELIEWFAAILLGQGADQFLGTQGDQWDTQSDMLMALVGAITALLTLKGVQDRQIAKTRTNRKSTDL